MSVRVERFKVKPAVDSTQTRESLRGKLAPSSASRALELRVWQHHEF